MVIFTRDRITTPFPTFAPKKRRVVVFKNDGIGNHEANKSERVINQAASRPRETPRQKLVVLKVARAITIMSSFQDFTEEARIHEGLVS